MVKKTSNKYGLSSAYLVLVLCFVLPVSLLSQDFSQADMEKKVKEYEEKLRKSKLSPIKLNIMLTKKEIKGWNGLKLRLNIFRDASKNLYDPTVSPFNTTIANSSQPESFTATSGPSSRAGHYKIHVKEIARRDKIATKPIKSGTKIKGSVFSVQTDKEEIKIDFSKGGTLKELYDLFDKQGNKKVRATFTHVDAENEMLVIEGAKTGEKYRLLLKGDKNFFRTIGFIKPPKKKTESFVPLASNGKEVIKGNYTIDKDVFVIEPESQILVALSKPMKMAKTSILEAEVKVQSVKVVKKKKDNKLPPIGTIEELDVERIKLFGDPLIPELKGDEDKKRKNKKKLKGPFQFLKLVADKNRMTQAIVILDTKNTWKKIRINLGPLLKGIPTAKKLYFENVLKNKSYSIRKIRIYDPLEDSRKGKYNFLEEAQDAHVLMNGVAIKRSKNEISDLIRGVVLSLKSPSEKAGELDIDWDYDQIIKELQKFLDEYNNVMLFLKNVMEYTPRKTLAILEKEEENFEKKGFDERQFMELSGEAYKGLMARDFAIRTLKNRLRNGMVYSPYPRTVQKSIKFLMQIGFKNPERGGDVLSNDNLKAGYLILDKKKLRVELESHFDEVKEIFAYAGKGSLIKNKGIAVGLVKNLNTYVKRGVRDDKGRNQAGFIPSKQNILKARVKREKRRFEVAEKRVMRKVDKTRRDFAKLIAAQRKAKFQRQKLDSFRPPANR